MIKDLKKRITTSLILLTATLLMLLNNHILIFFLIIGGILSLIEFFNLISIIFKKNLVNKFLSNIIFVSYIFIYCTFFVILSSILNLKILIFIILLTCVASDIGGYVFGKIFKGPKLTKLSPKKTVSGSLGSFLFSVLLICILVNFVTDNLDIYIVIIGLLTSLGCQIGDLFFSFLKRKSKLKDTGNFLPGHGGILDRIDGILLGIPVGFLSLLIIY
jgi:phosphatidate cytidylyltransferase